MKSYFSGMRAWLLQRVTALYLLGFIIYFTGHSLVAAPSSFADWRAWLLSTGPRIATLLFFAALALHGWVGLRDVAIDYIKPPALRLFVLTIVIGWLFASLIWVGLLLSGQSS